MLELDPDSSRVDLFEPLALTAQAQAVSFFVRPHGRSERASPIRLWRAVLSAIHLEGVELREAPTASLSSIAPRWLHARLEAGLGTLSTGPADEGIPVLALSPAALERLSSAEPADLEPFTLWARVPPEPTAGGLPDDTLSLAALARVLSAPEGAAGRALGLVARGDAQGRRLLYARNEGTSGALAREAVGGTRGVVEVAGVDHRLISFGERLQGELGLKWLLVAPLSTPLAQAVRRDGLVNQGPLVTVHPASEGAVIVCVEVSGSEDRCSAAMRVAAEAGVPVTRQPAYAPQVPGKPGRGGAFARAAGSAEIALWLPTHQLEAPSLPSVGELALFERAGFTLRRLSVASELRARCSDLRGTRSVDWRPLRQFRQSHQASLLGQQVSVLREAGCAPELWVDGEEALSFAACASDSTLSLEAIGEGRGELAVHCGEASLAPGRRPAHLEVTP